MLLYYFIFKAVLNNGYNHKMFNIGTDNRPDNQSTPTVIIQFVFEVYFWPFQHLMDSDIIEKKGKLWWKGSRTQAGLEPTSPTWAAWPNVIPQICTLF